MTVRCSIALVGLLASAACGSGAGKADGAAGGSATAGTGGTAGSGGTGGPTTAGTGGTADGGAVLTSCPTGVPSSGPACAGTFSCMYVTGCSCNGCCSAVYRCTDGRLMSSGSDYNDGCLQGTCAGGTACTIGQPETCDDDPDAGAGDGYCTIGNKCICPPGRFNSSSGRCLPP
jgi:hypothetical protein